MFLRWKLVVRRVLASKSGDWMGVLWPVEFVRLVLEYMHGRPGAGGGLPPL